MKTTIWLFLILLAPASSISQISGSAYKQQLSDHIGYIEGYSMVLTEPYPVLTDSVHINRKPWIRWHNNLLTRYAETVVNETFRQIDEWKLSRTPSDTLSSSFQDEVGRSVFGLLGFNPIIILTEFQPVDPRNQAQINALKKEFEKAFKERFVSKGKFVLTGFSETDREFYPVPYTLGQLQTLFESKIVEVESTPVTEPAQPIVPTTSDLQEPDSGPEPESKDETPAKPDSPSEPDPM